MSCQPLIETEYTTTHYTLYTDVWTTSTRRIPIYSAITTEDGLAYTPIRVVESSFPVERTTVVTSVVPWRTVIQECTSSATPTPSSSVSTSSDLTSPTPVPSSSISVETPSSSGQSATETSSSSSTTPETLPPSSSISSLTTITLTVPPSSPTPSPSSSSSSSTEPGSTAPALLSAEEQPGLSGGTIGGLAAGGVGLFLLILLALWFIQKQFGVGTVYSQRDLKAGKGGQGGRGGKRGRRGEGRQFETLRGDGDQVSEKVVMVDPANALPLPLHSRWSAVTLPPMFRPSAPTLMRASTFDESGPPRVPSLPQHDSRKTTHPDTSRPISAPHSAFTSQALHQARRDPATSPTPATLDRDDRTDAVRSLWNRLSAFTWRMSWSLPPPGIDVEALSDVSIQSRRGMEVHRHWEETEHPGLADLPAASTAGSARMGRIPSMVDLQEFGRGTEAITRPGPEEASTPQHLAPARPSSEFIREEDALTVPPPPPGGLPPPPMRSNSLVRNKSKRFVSTKSKTPSVGQGGSSRSSMSMTAELREIASGSVGKQGAMGVSRDGSRSNTTASFGTSHNLGSGQGRDLYPLIMNRSTPTVYAQPRSDHSSIIPPRPSRRPPQLHFLKEVSMPHLWMNDDGIAAINPDSTSALHPKTPDSRKSVYDGMTEISVTPESTMERGMVTPNIGNMTDGKNLGRGGLPALPPMDTAGSSSFREDWEVAVMSR